MKKVPITIVIINRESPDVISLNKLIGEKAPRIEFLLPELTEKMINATTEQKYIATINFIENLIISLIVICYNLG